MFFNDCETIEEKHSDLLCRLRLARLQLASFYRTEQETRDQIRSSIKEISKLEVLIEFLEHDLKELNPFPEGA